MKTMPRKKGNSTLSNKVKARRSCSEFDDGTVSDVKLDNMKSEKEVFPYWTRSRSHCVGNPRSRSLARSEKKNVTKNTQMSEKVEKEASPNCLRSRSRSTGNSRSGSLAQTEMKPATKNEKGTPKNRIKKTSVAPKKIGIMKEEMETSLPTIIMDRLSSPKMEMLKMQEIVSEKKIILLDIEGTTTSINFVQKVLIPYAEANFKQFIKLFWHLESVRSAVASIVKFQLAYSKREGYIPLPLIPENGLNEDFLDKLDLHLKWLQANSIFSPSLKFLQGLIWVRGFKHKEIEGHVYDDVPKAMRKWCEEEKKIFIYSHGSADSQKLLFKHSCFGDLDYLIDGYFDLKIGSKFQVISYQKILKRLKASPKDVVFFTDSLKEVRAAKFAKLKTILVSRDQTLSLDTDTEELRAADAVVPSFVP